MGVNRTSGSRGKQAGAGRRPGKSGSRQRGMTLIEAVLAAALVGIFASILIAAVNGAWRDQVRHRQIMGAVELANRLVIIYLDDMTDLPSPSLRLEYGPHNQPYRYRWEKMESAVSLVDPPDLPREVAARRRERGGTAGLQGQLRSVTFRVWLAEDDSTGRGSRTPEPGVPQAAITRLMNPLFWRNPDSTHKIQMKPELVQELFGPMLGPAPAAPAAPPRRREPR